MKVRPSPNVRVMTQVVTHYRHAVHQHAHDTNTMPAFGVSRTMDVRAVNVIHIPTATESARKSRVLKSGTRRVTYR